MPDTKQKSTLDETPKQEPTTTGAQDEVPTDMPSPTLESDLLPNAPRLKTGRNVRLVIIIVVVLIIAASAGWFLFARKTTPPGQPSSNNSPATEPVSNKDDVPEAQLTETYTNSPYRLTLKYPKTWQVTDQDDGSILAQSPDFSYKTVDAKSKTGNFRVYIRKGATTADSEIIAKGVAIQPSEKLTYTNPTASQRKETNLSFFGIDDTDNFAFVMITSNFDLKKGDTLGPNFGKETDSFIISGGYSESSMQTGMATNRVPTAGFQDTNAYKQAIQIIQSLEIT